MKQQVQRFLLLAPFASLWLGIFLIPVLMVFRVSLYQGGGASGFGIGGGGGYYQPGTWTWAALRFAFRDPTVIKITSFNIGFGVAVALLSLGIGLVIALGLFEISARFRQVLLYAVLIPKFANLLVIVYGLKWILSNSGPVNHALMALGLRTQPLDLLNNLPGAIIGKTYLIVPYVVLIMTSRFLQIDQNLVLVARSLGATTGQVHRRVLLPQSYEAFQTCLFISLVWGIGAYISPLFLGSPDQWTLSIEIQRQAFENINWPRGAALAVLLFVVFISVSSLFWLISNGYKKWAALH